MILVSYDISDTMTRTRFAKMLTKNGAIRLQFSVYEVVNTKRVIDNLMLKINQYAKHFKPEDSVIVFEVKKENLTKFGSAIHIDKDIVFI